MANKTKSVGVFEPKLLRILMTVVGIKVTPAVFNTKK